MFHCPPQFSNLVLICRSPSIHFMGRQYQTILIQISGGRKRYRVKSKQVLEHAGDGEVKTVCKWK